jgi:hypothetical protein
MLSHRLRGGLLQGVIGEQPVFRVVEFRGRTSAQQRGLDQYRRTVAELPSYGGDVGNTGRFGQPVAVDVAERLRSGLAAQIGDRVEVELYDGLTPVTMTL